MHSVARIKFNMCPFPVLSTSSVSFGCANTISSVTGSPEAPASLRGGLFHASDSRERTNS